LYGGKRKKEKMGFPFIREREVGPFSPGKKKKSVGQHQPKKKNPSFSGKKGKFHQKEA